ncbi:putative glucose transporter rco-3 [Venturia nashicola]|uniref:Putative glucose transporter rco-3 n=1 Tax=Venturia nashicola TaxID=86259 RepID=A0A4Z1P7Q1_9PEZI|nr:putative glucose transporter rco-3 [Venturia nashicola]
MVTSSAARSRTGSSSVATSRTSSRRANSRSAVEDTAQYSPINLASESPGANSNADSDVDMLDEEEGPAKRWFKEVLIDEPGGFDRTGYEFLDSIVDKVLEEEVDENGLGYRVRFRDRHEGTVSFDKLLELDNGKEALEKQAAGLNSESDFEQLAEPESESSEEEEMAKPRRTRARLSRGKAVTNFSSIQLSESDSDDEVITRKSTRGRSSRGRPQPSRKSKRRRDDSSEEQEEESEEEDSSRRRSGRRPAPRNQDFGQSRLSFAKHNGRTRSNRMEPSDDEIEDDEESSDDAINLLRSDVVPRRKRRKLHQLETVNSRSRKNAKPIQEATRRSGRETRHQYNMEEVGEGEIYRSDFDSRPAAIPKATGAKEAFKPLARGNKFRERHMQYCDTCKNSGNAAGQLVFCQGCSLSYHRACLGPRGGREHLVTKIDEDDFVLQCRRCVNMPQKKDIHAPNLARCQDCNGIGASCIPFRTRKSPAEEQREREQNGGQDPIADISPSLINNPANVMFRCIQCTRPFHYHHLESRNRFSNPEHDDEDSANNRFIEYSKDWTCKQCVDMLGKVSGLVAWRPTDANSYDPSLDVSIVDEDDKEYLVKWENRSYLQSVWMPGAWTWGVIAPAMRKAFFNKQASPKLTTEDAIPEEWVRIDIVLDVKYSNRVDIQGYEIDKARIKEVDTALIKYKGLGYEDAVWEAVPGPEDGERWTDFVTAYNDWVLGRYTTIPSATHLRSRIEKVRSGKFKEKAKQPDNLVGGELMKYQVDGLNWLYYQWYKQKNGILADEMGLGKTIQIIAFLATMVQDIKCYPFLVVVPNSTCPNWRREIKQWAPQLRVVTYYGSAKARQMAYEHELFPDNSRTLHCHVVITSYDAVVDESSRKFLKAVNWQGLIVDEGQRLKNDGSILHNCLAALKIPFRILLTGTPLQNNARELFNLLQFLDDKINASQMEEEFADMTNEKIMKLHGLIRPFILRRTKLQVLSFLPAMAQIILPVSMSVLQKRTYRSILEQRPELLRSLFSQGTLKKDERVGLNNILMQLRKCLCHPFVFNQAIEERHLDQTVTHANLVEASSKLQLLDVLLPKLQAAGHRVLIFSQFLNMLDIMEDFLEGMGMAYQRLDGNIPALEKQKRIDEYNSKNSQSFAFLLSTRAGGVGINLATADTVIILDPDFNPHQDIQAISRAHRIGQTKKVLCFQLMTRNSAEEKIMQMGRKKMALDEVVINKLDEEDVEEKDMEGILKHGMAEIFNDDNPEKIIKYDEESIDKLLDRTMIENTKSDKDDTAESQFSFARVWANDTAALQENLEVVEEEQAPDASFWEKILQEREKEAAERAARAKLDLGRGKRQRRDVNYDGTDSNLPEQANRVGSNSPELELPPITPEKPKRNRKRHNPGDDSDTDFQASESEQESADEQDAGLVDPRDLAEATSKAGTTGAILGGSQKPRTIGGIHQPPAMKEGPLKAPAFKRAQLKDPRLPGDPNARMTNGKAYPPVRACNLCNQTHFVGSCPMKLAGPEHCNICGMAHFGHGRVCPHFKSETQVRQMLDTLQQSLEPKYIVDAAKKYLKGLKGHLVQDKRKAAEKKAGYVNGMPRNGTDVPSLNGLNGSARLGMAGPSNGVNGQFGGQQPIVPWDQLPVEDRLMIITQK